MTRPTALKLEDFLQRRPYNAAAEFIDANVDRGLANKVAFTDDRRSLTYAELQDRSCRFASALRASGLHQESRIILICHDTVDYPIAFWGAVRAGVIPIPVNTLLTPEQYAYLFADSRAAATLVTAPLARSVLSIRPRLPDLRTVMVVGASAQDRTQLPDVLHFEDLLEEAEPTPFTAATLSDEVAFWIYTSGSTGDPKAVKHVHTSPMASALLMGQAVIGIREDDVAFSAAKLSFSYGLGNALLFPMSVGASTVLMPERPTPQAVLATLRRYRPTIFYAVPSLYATLLAQPDLGAGAGSDRLRLCISAGEIGELMVRGPTAAEGYWNQRAKSRRTFAGEWTCTGDKFVRDQDGYYHYCGRTDDMFKVNGMWVSPFEVEAALLSHEAVLEAAVIGKPDGDGLIRPKAFIVLKDGYGADAQLMETLRLHVKDRAGAWKYPRWIDIRPDLPRTATGKIQRFKLRE